MLWDPGTMQRVLPPPVGTTNARAIRYAGVPVDGAPGVGTGAGVVDRGWQCVNTLTGDTYTNAAARPNVEWHGVIIA